MNNTEILIADIGGTNARFALAAEKKGQFRNVQTLACKDFTTADEAISAYLDSMGVRNLSGICLAVAGPVIDQTAKFLNNPWQVNGRELQQRWNTDAVRILNDFEVQSYALPLLLDEDLIAIGGDWSPVAKTDCTYGVLGPGTGLGVGALAVRDGAPYPVKGEGGHVGFAPYCGKQSQLLETLQKKYSRVSIERLLSGDGIQNIYSAICEISGQSWENLSAAQIGQRFISAEDAACIESMSIFFEILGQTAGDLALTLGAFDGIFIGGGIVQRYSQELMVSRFREGFERKGRYTEILQKVPVWLINHEYPGLIGASYYAKELLCSSAS